MLQNRLWLRPSSRQEYDKEEEDEEEFLLTFLPGFFLSSTLLLAVYMCAWLNVVVGFTWFSVFVVFKRCIRGSLNFNQYQGVTKWCLE